MENWKGKTAVYTCVVTDFEHQGKHKYQDGVDYLYFTDGQSAPLEKEWKIHKLPDLEHLHPRRVSKLPKHYPQFFDKLREYEYLIWIDGDMQIKHDNFVGELMSYLHNGMVLSPHFDNRHCAYGEATIRPPKYQSEPMDQQVAFYQEDGFPHNYGLYETGVMARDLSHDKANLVGAVWYVHNMVWSYQDQVSLPYVLWKLNYKPDVLPKSFRSFDWVHINAHKSES